MGAGIAKCIADVLRADTVSVPASGYVTLYPQYFNAASAVPTFLYQSLKDIWLGGTTASGYSDNQWAAMVVDSFGNGKVGPRTIDVISNRVLPQEDGPRRNNPMSNDTGAQWAEIFIYLKIGGQLSATDTDRCSNAELRIQRLIDYQYRTNTTNTPEIPITDNTINPLADVKVHWTGLIGQTNKDVYTVYDCYYTRLFLK